MLLDIEPKYGSCNETYLGEGEGLLLCTEDFIAMH